MQRKGAPLLQKPRINNAVRSIRKPFIHSGSDDRFGEDIDLRNIRYPKGRTE